MNNFIKFFKDKKIYPFDARYSQITMLNNKQLKSYKYIFSELLKGHKVDIADNLSYLFVILHETTRDIITTKDFKYAIDVITKLKILYSEFDILKTYCLLPRVNEGWISEAKLYYAIKQEFSHYTVIHQYRCKCLGLQSLDIFIKELNIGIEYQGAQHIRPVEYFGGKEAFKKTQERDKKKKRLCNKNGIKLIYVYENYVLDDVFNEIKMRILD